MLNRQIWTVFGVCSTPTLVEICNKHTLALKIKLFLRKLDNLTTQKSITNYFNLPVHWQELGHQGRLASCHRKHKLRQPDHHGTVCRNLLKKQNYDNKPGQTVTFKWQSLSSSIWSKIWTVNLGATSKLTKFAWLKLTVVNFSQQMGDLHAISWSKSSFSAF